MVYNSHTVDPNTQTPTPGGQRHPNSTSHGHFGFGSRGQLLGLDRGAGGRGRDRGPWGAAVVAGAAAARVCVNQCVRVCLQALYRTIENDRLAHFLLPDQNQFNRFVEPYLLNRGPGGRPRPCQSRCSPSPPRPSPLNPTTRAGATILTRSRACAGCGGARACCWPRRRCS